MITVQRALEPASTIWIRSHEHHTGPRPNKGLHQEAGHTTVPDQTATNSSQNLACPPGGVHIRHGPAPCHRGKQRTPSPSPPPSDLPMRQTSSRPGMAQSVPLSRGVRSMLSQPPGREGGVHPSAFHLLKAGESDHGHHILPQWEPTCTLVDSRSACQAPRPSRRRVRTLWVHRALDTRSRRAGDGRRAGPDCRSPRLTEDTIEIGFENGILTIRGETEERTGGGEGRYHVRERRFGRFERSFTVPRTVSADAITATFRKGVLHVHMPKAPESKGRTIEIRTTS